jgi:hypothetical protein
MEGMRLSTRLLHFAEDVFTLGVTLASDAIDSWSSGESRQALLTKLREAVQRASELALDKARLEEQVDKLRFNGPSLYKDEVDALVAVISSLNIRVQTELTSTLEQDRARLKSLRGLLDRCDHLPFTAEDLGNQIDDVLSGKAKSYTWDDMFGSNDPGKDVDDEDIEWPDDGFLFGEEPRKI